MSSKYTVASGTGASDRLGGTEAGICTLSDGTVVFLAYDAAAFVYKIYYLDVGRTVANAGPTIPTGYQTGSSTTSQEFYSLCRDASDNLFLIGLSAASSSTLRMQAFQKGAGYTWTAKTATEVNLSGNSETVRNIVALWVNTGGGVSGGGHVVVSIAQTGVTGRSFRSYDAGALLAGTTASQGAFGNLNNTQFGGTVNDGSQYGLTDMEPDGFGSGTILVALQVDSANGWVGVAKLTVTSASITLTALTTSGNHLQTGGGTTSSRGLTSERFRVIRYAAGAWVVLVPVWGGKVSAQKFSSTAKVGTQVDWVTPSGVVVVTGRLGVVWDAFRDPVTANRVWVLVQGTTSTTIVRVALDLSGTSPVWDTVTTTGDTLVLPSGGTISSIRALKNPITASAYGDFLAWGFNGATYYLNGDYISFINPTPTAVTPANGSTIATDVPTLGITFAAGPGQKGQWQLATDTAFTLNLRTITEADADVVSGPATNTEVVPNGSALFQGTWYLRGRSVGPGGIAASPWSATNTLTNTHPPSASALSPNSSQYLQYGTAHKVFSWAFNSTSPVSTQSAYQIICERNSDGAVIFDTGKVTSTATSHDATDTPFATYKDTLLRWKIRLWDNDNVVGAYSSYSLFEVGDIPTVSVTAPAEGSTVTTNTPTFTWTFAAGGGRTQVSRRIKVVRNTDSAVLHDSGVLSSSSTSYTPASPILVDNTTSHTVTVTVVDSGGLTNSDSNTFTTGWTAPATPSVTVSTTAYDSSGYIRLSWNDAAVDANFSSWRIYRRLTGTVPWTMIGEMFTHSASNIYDDYSAGNQVSYDYAVVQVANRFGSLIESSYVSHTATGSSTRYWLLFGSAAENFPLYNATGDSFSDEYEEEEIHLIGRGRHLDYGDRLGYKGSITAQLRDIPGGQTARQQRLQIELVKSQQKECWLRTPFGDVWQIVLSNLTFDRIGGVGLNEFCDVTIPYVEVSD